MKLKGILKKISVAPLVGYGILASGIGLASASSLREKINSSATASQQSMGLSTGDLTTTIGTIIQGLLGLLGTVFVLLMIYAGFLYMTAQGNEEQVEKAKDLIKNSIIGIVIIFLAYAITNFVIAALPTA